MISITAPEVQICVVGFGALTNVGLAGVNIKPAGTDGDQTDDVIVSIPKRNAQLICPRSNSPGAIGSHTIIYASFFGASALRISVGASVLRLAGASALLVSAGASMLRSKGTSAILVSAGAVADRNENANIESAARAEREIIVLPTIKINGAAAKIFPLANDFDSIFASNCNLPIIVDRADNVVLTIADNPALLVTVLRKNDADILDVSNLAIKIMPPREKVVVLEIPDRNIVNITLLRKNDMDLLDATRLTIKLALLRKDDIDLLDVISLTIKLVSLRKYNWVCNLPCSDVELVCPAAAAILIKARANNWMVPWTIRPNEAAVALALSCTLPENVEPANALMAACVARKAVVVNVVFAIDVIDILANSCILPITLAAILAADIILAEIATFALMPLRANAVAMALPETAAVADTPTLSLN